MRAVNTVDVDSPGIDVALDALAAGAAPGFESFVGEDPPGPGQEIPADPVQVQVEWAQALSGVVELFAKVVAPNWQLDDAERALLVDQGSKTLDAFFPNVILEGKWLALFTFSLCAGGVVMKRFDVDTLTFRPLRIDKVSKPPGDAQASASPSPAARPDASASTDGTGKLRVVAPAWNGRGA